MMNDLLRTARRSLCWGLFVALSLAAVVLANGIHPSVLIAFQPKLQPVPQTDFSAEKSLESNAPRPPEFYARAETSSRLDVEPVAGSSVFRSLDPALKQTHRLRRPLAVAPTLPEPSTADDSSHLLSDVPQADDQQGPALEPGLELPNERRLIEPMPATKTPPSNVPTLPPHPDELTRHETVKPGPILSRDAVAPTAKVAVEQPDLNSALFVERLMQMQRQLDQLALAQQQERHAARSLFETTQMFQQRKLEEKLEGIERGLQELRAERRAADRIASPAAPIPNAVPMTITAPPVPTENKTTSTIISNTPQVREVPSGADGKQRFSVNSHGGNLRQLLDALAQKANFNLVLAINVEGDVELSLQNVTLDEALEAIQKATGYVVVKSGQKVYIGPSRSHPLQRQDFLPPIIKN